MAKYPPHDDRFPIGFSSNRTKNNLLLPLARKIICPSTYTQKIAGFEYPFSKIFIVCLYLVLNIFGFIYLNNKISVISNNNEDVVLNDNIIISTISDEDENFIFVDVKGAIKKPGVYKLEFGSRVIDAINIAGGLVKDANTLHMNLSDVLKDSDIVKVYTNKEIENAKKEDIQFRR